MNIKNIHLVYYSATFSTMHDVVKEHRAKGGFTKRIGINEAQKIATRVWQGIERRMPGRKKLFFQQQIRPALSVSNTAVLSGG